MGGIAAVIDWRDPADPALLAKMMNVVPHRRTAGIRYHASDRAQLAEARTRGAPGWEIVTDADVTIVGDFRLWNQGQLRSVAGGRKATEGLSDRRLVLAAYRRAGLQRTMDAIDGDFAFVLWDSKHRSMLAVRDRFGVIPLFYQLTPNGVRFATEPKQLVVVSEVVHPDRRAIADFLSDRRTCERDTYFEGIHRVLPAEVMEATEGTVTQRRYWSPEPIPDLGVARSEVPGIYREHLTDAVKRRLDTSEMTISQLSGGLDSTSISASAQILTDRGYDADRFATVSYIVPGSTVDESEWISEIVDRQPFAHHEFIPRLDGIDAFLEDMWCIDRPFVVPNRDFHVETANYGKRLSADLLLTGNAGDFVMDDDDLVADMVRQGSLGRAWRTLRATAAWSHVSTRELGTNVLRKATPQGTKDIIRRVTPSKSTKRLSLLTDDLHSFATNPACRPPDLPVGFPSSTQASVVVGTRSGELVQINEAMEAHAARSGMSVSHPHLDRSLVEFVVSVPITQRPADGRTKSIVRYAFRDYLPDSVIDRTSTTYATDHIVDLLTEAAPAMTDRFPSVTEQAAQYIDGDRYLRAVEGLRSNRPDIHTFRQVWPAWTLMMWLDTLHRYG